MQVESKYYKELLKLKENDTRRDKVIAQLINSADNALMQTAAKNEYDFVCDEGDSSSEKYEDITAKVIKQMQENEKMD